MEEKTSIWLYYTSDNGPGECYVFGSLEAAQRYHQGHALETPDDWQYNEVWEKWECYDGYTYIREEKVRV